MSRSQILTDVIGSLPPEPGSGDLRSRFARAVSTAFPGWSIRIIGFDPSLQEQRTSTVMRVRIGSPDSPVAWLDARTRGGRAATPDERHEVLRLVDLAALVLEIERVRDPCHRVTERPDPGSHSTRLVGSSPVMCQLRERIARVAPTEFTILVEGESGTGKELVAHELHALSAHPDGPFVALNCAAIVDSLLEAELFGIEARTATGVDGRIGKFEQADGGTLFLDEIADLSATAQAKLLRIIQSQTVERVGGRISKPLRVRIVAATNRSLEQCVAQKTFRPDLYYRLSGIDIRVPPLRARREDIAELIDHLLARYRSEREMRVTALALAALESYDWPGNVRELERSIEHAVALAPTEDIRPQDLPRCVTAAGSLEIPESLDRNDTLRTWSSHYVRLMLRRHDGNKRRACEALGITYHTLQAHLGSESEATRATGAAIRSTAGGHGVTESITRRAHEADQ